MRAAAVQLNAKADKAANLEKADRLVRRAAADGAELVVLPEKWTALGTGDDLRAAAEPVGAGEASTWASGVARELGIDLVAGSISERIEGDEQHRWTIDQIASRAGTSRTVLTDRFKVLLGRPPIDYLAGWRIQLAAERLRAGSESVPRIAASVGYESEAAFNRAFKRITGLTPGNWRAGAVPVN